MADIAPDGSGCLDADGRRVHWERFGRGDRETICLLNGLAMLIMAGAEDRAIPPWVQRKLCDFLPYTRFDLVEASGHCVYIERPDVFFGNLKRFARAKSLDF